MKMRLLIISLSAAFVGTVSANAQAATKKPSSTNKNKPVMITILHTNDHHGRFWKNSDGEYGLSAQKTVIDEIRSDVKKQGGQILVLSGGDINTGVPESDMQNAEPDFKGMSLIGFDAMALGNHEFDNSLSVLAKQQKWGKFPFLSANTTRNGKAMFEPYKIFNKGGVKIAVLGLTTDDTKKLVSPDVLAYNKTWTSGSIVNPASSAGIQFQSPIESAQKFVPMLNKKADVVIAATHMGHYADAKHGSNTPGDVSLARAVPGIDLIVGGHSQNPVCMKAENVRDDEYVPGAECKPDQQNGAYIVQAHEWGKYVGRADFSYQNGKFTLVKYALIPINLKKSVKLSDETKIKINYTPQIEEDEKMLKLLQPYQDKGQEVLGVEIGSTKGDLNGDRKDVRSKPTNLGVMIASAMQQKTKADFAIMNSGGVRDSIKSGVITYKDVLKVQPFGNVIGYADLKGSEVQSYMNTVATMTPGSGGFAQFSGISATLSNGSANNISINGAPLDPNKTYRMAVNDFVAAGGDGYPKLKGVNPTYINSGYVDADLLKEFIKTNSPIDANKYDPGSAIIRQ